MVAVAKVLVKEENWREGRIARCRRVGRSIFVMESEERRWRSCWRSKERAAKRGRRDTQSFKRYGTCGLELLGD